MSNVQVTNCNAMNIYEKPDNNSRIIFVAIRNQRFMAEPETLTWAHIRALEDERMQIEGYVLSTFLTPTEI